MASNVVASVIVPTRGGVHRLPRLVDSLAQQNRQDFETVFVVDGDVDGSYDYLSSDGVKQKLGNSKVIVFPQNMGRSEALNAGHEAAQGEVLIRCDDDLEPKPDFIQAHVKRQESGPRGTIGLYRNVFPSTPYSRAYGVDADKRFTQSAIETSPDMQWRYWAGNVSISREIWRSVGKYDLKYRTYGWEDVDYGYRIHQAGYPVEIAPELTTNHYVAAVTTRIRAVRALHSGASREKFVETHGEGVLPETVGSGIWDKSVSFVSKFATEKSIDVAGGLVDTMIAKLPMPVGRKLVALTVESAGRAGIRYPNRAKSSF